MNTHVKTASAMFIGVLLSVLCLYGLYTSYQDHVALQSVINFLNSQIAEAQKTAPVSK